MSYFVFGTFSSIFEKKSIEQVRSFANGKNIFIWFGEEISFYKDINRMIEEQKSNGNIKFAITSKNQPRNSSDVLFPFDKFDSEVLFADKSRAFYKQCCRDNIEILFSCLKKLINTLHIKKIDIFVVEGYDDVFKKKMCSIDELKQDLLYQIEDKVLIDSCIYYVRLN